MKRTLFFLFFLIFANGLLAQQQPIIISDTVFYSTGRIFHLKKYAKVLQDNAPEQAAEQLEDIYEEKYYAQDGTLCFDFLPDSLILIPFKDNVDCYYGLKNRRGDTIYPPQFDDISRVSRDIWEADKGRKAVMMRQDGKILSSVQMSGIAPIEKYKESRKLIENQIDKSSDFYLYESIPSAYTQYFSFAMGKKWGIINRDGQVILPPQYPRFVQQDSAATFFEVATLDTTLKDKKNYVYQVIDRKGRYVLENYFPQLELSGVPHFFKFATTVTSDTSEWQYFSLVHESGEILLDATYASIDEQAQSHLFWVSEGKRRKDESGKKYFDDFVYGLFDPEKRAWILPCVYDIEHKSHNIILTDTRTKKMGMVSYSGAIILPFVYDKIELHNDFLYIVIQNGQYQIFDGRKRQLSKETYQYLYYMRKEPPHEQASLKSETTDTAFFVAKQNDKWGVIDLNGVVFAPFDYDYAGQRSDYYSKSKLALVKGSHATIFNVEFLLVPESDDTIKTGKNARSGLLSFNLLGYKAKNLFYVNPQNQVLYPPQYRSIDKTRDWDLLENEQKERLLLFPRHAIVLPFPFKNKLLWAREGTPFGILSDEKRTYFEVFNLKTQQIYHRINAGGVAIDYFSNTYFVKTDTPILTKHYLKYGISRDTFGPDDDNWKMFDSLGKPLTTNAFRYPIRFWKGSGVGAVGDKFGVWRSDGTTIVPPQYDNVRLTLAGKQVVLYQQIGLKNWMLLTKTQTGEILIGAGRYDGISEFYGKYALVSLGDKVGLVDTLGREIIAPMSLHNDAVNLVDSLKISKYDHYYLKTPPLAREEGPQTFIFPDSMALPNAIRNRVWHYLLQTQIKRDIKRGQDRFIERAEGFKTYEYHNDPLGEWQERDVFHYLFADSLHISFVFTNELTEPDYFRNYGKTKTGWQQWQLSDILNLNRDNTLKINVLMQQKLRQLSNNEIDCGDSSSFVERVRATFLTNSEGILFYFKSPHGDNYFNYVPILLTWAELQAFRTPQ